MYPTMANTQQRYQEQCILTASPVELIVMLYDACIKQLKLAKIAINAKDIPKSNNALLKAQNIIVELVNSLDMSISLSADLLNLYDFILNELITINVEKNAERIDGVLGILEELRNAWRQIAKKASGTAALAEE